MLPKSVFHPIRGLKQPLFRQAVIGKQKCSDFGKMICSKIGNNGTMFSATRVQYYWQQCCSTSKGSIFLIDSSIIYVTSVVELAAGGQLYDAAPGASV